MKRPVPSGSVVASEFYVRITPSNPAPTNHRSESDETPSGMRCAGGTLAHDTTYSIE
jgi:hypothetical protein